VNGDCPVTPEPEITHEPPVIATPMPYNPPPPRILRCGSRLPVGRQQRIQIVGGGECALRFLGAPGWKLVFIAEPLARDVPVTMTIYDAEGHVIAGPAASEPGIRLELRALQQTSGEHRVVIEASSTVPVLVTWTTEYKMTGRPACGSTLDYGRPVTVSIPSVGARCEHDFDGHPNQRVRIIIRPDASKIEPAMTLRSPTKKSVTSALATAEVNLPTRGRYTLSITDRYNNAKGAYTVTSTLISIATALAD